MRCYVNLTEGTGSGEYPARAGGYRQLVKALTGERVEIRFIQHGSPYALPSGTELKLVVRDTKGGVLLAEQTSFTAPDDVSSGFYTARLSFNTVSVVTLLAANPLKTSLPVLGEILWKLSGATDWEASDDLQLTLQRKVSTGDDEGNPLGVPQTITAGGFMRYEAADGTVYHLALNLGEPPA